MADQRPKCVLKWPGGKWSIAGWIADRLPRTPIYLELFFGSGGVLAAREPVVAEVANDLDDQVVEFFQVLRDEPEALAAALELTPWSRTEWERAEATPRPRGRPSRVERARRFLIRQWMSHGHLSRQGHGTAPSGWRHNGAVRDDHCVTTTWRGLPDRVRLIAERLRRVQFESRPALDVLGRHAAADVLVYADPPYLGAARRNKQRLYKHEMMGAEEHAELLAALGAHPGPVAISHYRCDLYDAALLNGGWAIDTIGAVAEHGNRTVEALYTNPRLQELMAGSRRQVGLFAEEGAPC